MYAHAPDARSGQIRFVLRRELIRIPWLLFRLPNGRHQPRRADLTCAVGCIDWYGLLPVRSRHHVSRRRLGFNKLN